MIVRRFVSLVPRSFKWWALIVGICPSLIGLVIATATAETGRVMHTMLLFVSAGLVAGALLALWILSLGYVYADARRRHMRAVLWVCVTALVPHLLGFLLYFVLREPITSGCVHCGAPISLDQRFCSSCGAPHHGKRNPLASEGLAPEKAPAAASDHNV